MCTDLKIPLFSECETGAKITAILLSFIHCCTEPFRCPADNFGCVAGESLLPDVLQITPAETLMAS